MTNLKNTQLAIVDCTLSFDALEQIKSYLPDTANILAIVKNTLSDKKRAFVCGAQDLCTKPILQKEIYVRIDSAISILDDSFLKYPNQKRPFGQAKNISDGSLEVSTSPPLNLVEKTCAYLMDHLGEKHSLGLLVRKMGTNRNTLSLLFKQEFNMGVFCWLRSERMKRAKYYLVSSEVSISEICVRVGYNNLGNFSTCFKRYYQCSPHEYRKEMTQSKK